MSDKWYDLINASAQERTAISLKEVEEETQDRIEALVKATFMLNHIVCFNAKRIQDEYKNIYTDVKEREKQLPESERGKKSNLRFRVRLSKKHTLMAEWYREKYRYGEIYHETLSRDYKYAYSPKVFNKEPTWAKENGKRAEKRLSILREQNDLLHSMRKILYRLSDLTASYHALSTGSLSIDNDDIPEDILALAGIEPEDFSETKNLELLINGKKMDEWLEATYHSDQSE